MACFWQILPTGPVQLGNPNGPIIDPWGIPLVSGLGTEHVRSILMDWFLLVKDDLHQLRAESEVPGDSSNLLNNTPYIRLCQMPWKDPRGLHKHTFCHQWPDRCHCVSSVEMSLCYVTVCRLTESIHGSEHTGIVDYFFKEFRDIWKVGDRLVVFHILTVQRSCL